jgi:uncharacterized protein
VIHPASELRYISDDIGYGVFATEPIPRGTLLWVLDEFDRVLTGAEVRGLPPLLRAVVDKYAYVAADGTFVLCWDLGRYMNHSCAPSSRGVGEAFEVTVRDIEPGDELTCDYGTLNLAQPLHCRCGAPGCRGVVRRDDSARLYEQWDDEAARAFALSPDVAQPLLPFAKVGAADEPLLEWLRSGVAADVPSARQYYVPDVEAIP